MLYLHKEVFYWMYKGSLPFLWETCIFLTAKYLLKLKLYRVREVAGFNYKIFGNLKPICSLYVKPVFPSLQCFLPKVADSINIVI